MPAYVLVRCDRSLCEGRASSTDRLNATTRALEAWLKSLGWAIGPRPGEYLCPRHAAARAATHLYLNRLTD